MDSTKTIGDADIGTALARERTAMAGERTDLALERNYMAAERTLMAWVRTALSMISFGFTIGKLKDMIQGAPVTGAIWHARSVSTQSVATFLVILGTGSLFIAGFEYLLSVRRLRGMGLRRRIGLAFYVAIALAVLGAFALTSLIMAF